MSRNVVLIKHPKNWGLDAKVIEGMVEDELKKRGFRENTEVSLIFVGTKKAKWLNQTYRQKDYIPQVLGFPMSLTPDEDGIIRLGDIMICTKKLKYEVIFQKKDLEEVLRFWIEHGVDNLLKK